MYDQIQKLLTVLGADMVTLIISCLCQYNQIIWFIITNIANAGNIVAVYGPIQSYSWSFQIISQLVIDRLLSLG